MRKKFVKKGLTVGFIALGCPKNTVDSEKMLAKIAEAGMVITAEVSEADVIIINTCGFISPAKLEAFREIRFAVECKKTSGVRKVIVAGCLAQRMGVEMLEEISGIDAIVGLEQRDNIAEIIQKTVKSK